MVCYFRLSGCWGWNRVARCGASTLEDVQSSSDSGKFCNESNDQRKSDDYMNVISCDKPTMASRSESLTLVAYECNFSPGTGRAPPVNRRSSRARCRIFINLPMLAHPHLKLTGGSCGGRRANNGGCGIHVVRSFHISSFTPRICFCLIEDLGS
jgi:hypothetical protein